MAKGQKSVDMTQGTIWKLLLSFAVPMLIGQIFQQLYSAVDSVVVGRFVGKEALAAVGSTGSVINSLIGFFTGLAMGAGVVISQSFGAKDEKGVHDAVHTALLLTPTQNYKLQLFSGYVASVQDDAWKLTFDGDNDFEGWLARAVVQSCFESPVTPTEHDHVVTLSTCSYEFQNARFVVHGILK